MADATRTTLSPGPGAGKTVADSSKPSAVTTRCASTNRVDFINMGGPRFEWCPSPRQLTPEVRRIRVEARVLEGVRGVGRREAPVRAPESIVDRGVHLRQDSSLDQQAMHLVEPIGRYPRVQMMFEVKVVPVPDDAGPNRRARTGVLPHP